MDQFIYSARLVAARMLVLFVAFVSGVHITLKYSGVERLADTPGWKDLFFLPEGVVFGVMGVVLVIAILLAYGQKEERRRREARARVTAVHRTAA